MDDDKKTILLLKLGVGFLVFLGLLAVIALIVNLTGNGSSLDKSGVTTRRTLSKEVTTSDVSTSDLTTDVVTSDTTTSTSSSTTTLSPETSAPIVNTTKKTTVKTTKTTTTTTTTQVTSPIPDNDYTVIDSSNSSGQYNSNEWSIVNYINNNRSKKYKVALELRNAAIVLAKKACEYGIASDADNYFDNNYDYNYHYVDAIYGLNADVSTFITRLNDNSNAKNKIINGQLEYIGVGEAVSNNSAYPFTCYAVIVAD